jgi:hypothetical protein
VTISPNAPYNPSPAALRPLMDMFWSPQGWRTPPAPPPTQVLSQAVADGVMFAQPKSQDHDSWVEAARVAAASVSVAEVGDAFMESLSTRRLDLRSALGSYAIARVLPEHTFAPRSGAKDCAVCGLYRRTEEDLNVLNFERFKWGGVRRDDVGYIAFDLDQWAPRGGSTNADVQIGRRLIETLRQLADDTTAPQAAAHLSMVKGNKAERENVLDILGVCGILQTPDHHGYRQEFVPVTQREDPPLRFVERTYPVSWWKGQHGVNDQALQYFLPQLA